MRNTGELRVETPLGPVVVRVLDDHSGWRSERIEVQASTDEVHPQLPPGMRIDRAVRIDLKMRALDDGVAPRILFTLDESLGLKGSPDPGEWLETVEVEHGSVRLSLGARDQEWMLTRGPEKSMLPRRFEWTDYDNRSTGYELSFTQCGMLIAFDRLVCGEVVICPLALAYVSGPFGSDGDVWTWFGVDAVLP